MPSNHLILCHPLLLPSVFPSIRVFSNESAFRIRWLQHQSLSISPFSEYSGLISFRTDWFHLLAVQGILKSSSTPQFKSINSLAVSFLYDPTLTSIHDYWKNCSFDYMDLCWQKYQIPIFVSARKPDPLRCHWYLHSSFRFREGKGLLEPCRHGQMVSLCFLSKRQRFSLSQKNLRPKTCRKTSVTWPCVIYGGT